MLSFLNSNTGPPGAIYFTTDGSDPRLVGGAVNSASAQLYSSPVSLAVATHVKARILRNGQWSALTEAAFTPVVISPDFDVDGDVDGSDFLAWQRGLGASGNATAADGDADGDKDVDGVDLTYWNTQFGVLATAALAAEVTSPSEQMSSALIGGDLDAQASPTSVVPSNVWFTLTKAATERTRFGAASSAARLGRLGSELRPATRATIRPSFEPDIQATAAFWNQSRRHRDDAPAANRPAVDDAFERWDELARHSIASWL
jgi:hypothetical protein